MRGGVDLLDDPAAARGNGGARIPSHHLLHAGADQRRFGTHERHRLALHVGAHQRPVGVVVLQEGDERGGDRDELLRRDVHVVDALWRRHDELAVVAAAHQVLDERALLVRHRVGLRNRVLPLLDRRQIDDLVSLSARFHLAVGAFDKAVAVDPRVGGEAVDEPDVGAFGRFHRADAPVVRRVHVAHLEARPLAREPAGPERGQPPLVGDLRERVGLVHELGELRRAEELAHGRRRRLGVDQVVRHDGVDINRAHALANGAFHPEQADAVLVLHQLADRAHPAVAQVVDVIDIAATVLQRDEGGDDGDDILAPQHPEVVVAVEIEPHAHLHAADIGEVVALGADRGEGRRRHPHGILGLVGPVGGGHDDPEPVFLLLQNPDVAGLGALEPRDDVAPLVRLGAGVDRFILHLGLAEEEIVEELLGGLDGRRLARPHDLVDLEQRLFAARGPVLPDGVADVGADVDVVDIEDGDLVEPALLHHFERLFLDLAARLDQHLPGFRVDHVIGGILPDELVGGDQLLGHAGVADLLEDARGHAAPRLDHGFAGGGVHQVVEQLVAAQALGLDRRLPAVIGPGVRDLGVEVLEDLFRIHGERAQQHRHRQLAAPVDTDEHQVLGIELEVEQEPR